VFKRITAVIIVEGIALFFFKISLTKSNIDIKEQKYSGIKYSYGSIFFPKLLYKILLKIAIIIGNEVLIIYRMCLETSFLLLTASA